MYLPKKSASLNLLLLALLLLQTTLVSAADGDISYNRDIRPILSDNCFKCHGPDANAREEELRLDIREVAVENRGGYFAIDPGNAKESDIIWRIHSEDSDELMPPPDSGKSLTEAEKDILFKWIDEGAGYEAHWSFIQPVRPELPDVDQKSWVRNPIDRFVLSRLEAEGLSPAPVADPVRLRRRIHFDLTGLPPGPAKSKSIKKTASKKFYADIVDGLLESPRYGERMASEWLDVVRFADTNGYHSDEYRDMHPYRDYVIAAFNDNKPFDEFTIEQLAGDLFPEPTMEQKIASGYNRLNQITSEGGAQPKEYIAKYMSDRVRNLGSVWMGATLGCAECHDHKFDPVSTREFYQYGAFFADIKEQGKYSHGNNGYAPFLNVPTHEEQQKLSALQIDHDVILASKPGSVREDAEWRKTVEESESNIMKYRKTITSTLITEAVEPREIRVLPRGNWLDNSGEVVQARTPEYLPTLETEGEVANRMDLARWLVSPKHPLTARTYVNRLWAQFFGRGISPVMDDLGLQGAWPTHPELLDWLAVEFIESGWDVKHMVRLIVTSNTYRQSTMAESATLEADPDNRLFGRQTPRRLTSEMIRDNALALSDLLDDTVGGASVKPYQPESYYDDTYAGVGKLVIYTADEGRLQYRRGLYTFWKRSFLHPSLLAFDAPSREECVVDRPISNTPQQALVLLNDPTYVEEARAFAVRLIQDGGSNTEDRIAHAFVLALSREATETELNILSSLYEQHLREYRANPSAAAELLSVGLWNAPDDIPEDELAAWTSVARTILNLHEMITRY